MKFIANTDVIGLQAGLNAISVFGSFTSERLVSLEKGGEFLLHSNFVLSFFKEFLATETEIGFSDGILQQVAFLGPREARKRQNNDG